VSPKLNYYIILNVSVSKFSHVFIMLDFVGYHNILWQTDGAMKRPDMDFDVSYAMVFRMHQTETSIHRQRFPFEHMRHGKYIHCYATSKRNGYFHGNKYCQQLTVGHLWGNQIVAIETWTSQQGVLYSVREICLSVNNQPITSDRTWSSEISETPVWRRGRIPPPWPCES
jgi:hypothetical protein